MTETGVLGLVAIPAGLGLLFGLNVPACAAPLLLALLAGTAAAPGVTLLGGFVSLAVFGLALSLPLVVAVLIPAARGLLHPVWATVAMAASVTTIFANSLWGRPRLFVDAVLSVGRPLPTTGDAA